MDDPVRELTAAFLDAHAERAVEELSGGPGCGRYDPFLPIHRTLFDLARTEIREPFPGRAAEGVRRVWAKTDAGGDFSALLRGQFDLWAVVHRLLREEPGPHREMAVNHPALVLAGEALDGVSGALIEAAQPENAPGSSSRWGTLVELGRMRREGYALDRTFRDLLNARDPAQMFQALEMGILDTFHIRGLTIAAVNRQEEVVEVVCAYPATPGSRDPVGWRYRLSHPDILCHVARTGRAEVIDGWDPRYYERVTQPDGSAAFRQRPTDHNRGRTAFFVPIRAGEDAIGIVCTASEQSSKALVLRELERMQPFLHQSGETLRLASEIVERRRTEEDLKRAREDLRVRIRERTAELVRVNASLTSEVAERRQAEEALHEIQGGLERRVVERTTELLNAVELLRREITEHKQTQEQLQALSHRLLKVQEEERRHVARELHDEIGQALTAIKVHLMAMQDSLGPDAEVPDLEESVAVVESTLQQVRDLSLNLRPAMLDDLGLVPALRWYAVRAEQQGGFTVQWDLDPSEPDLPQDVQTTCFRVVQEALTNAVRHARAGRVRIELRFRDGALHLVVRDDGVGFDVEEAMERASDGVTLGLLGMKERVGLLGGRLEIESAIRYGTEIRARIPLEHDA